MRRPKRTLWILTIVVAAAVAGCGTTGPAGTAETWTGTTTYDGTSHGLTVEVVREPDGAWTGTYTLETSPSFTGEVVATVADQALTGDLVATGSCRYALEGTIDGDVLVADFEPAPCDGASSGSWTLDRSE